MFKKKSVLGVRPLLRSGNICVLEKPRFFQFPAKCKSRFFFKHRDPTMQKSFFFRDTTPEAETRRCKSRFFFATQPRRRRPADAKLDILVTHTTFRPQKLSHVPERDTTFGGEKLFVHVLRQLVSPLQEKCRKLSRGHFCKKAQLGKTRNFVEHRTPVFIFFEF